MSYVNSARPRGMVLAVLLGVAGGLLVWQLPGGEADAQSAAAVKRIGLTVDCKLTRGAVVSPCRGMFKIRGGFSDSGRLSQSSSSDPGEGHGGIRAILRGKKGTLSMGLEEIKIAHKKRSCLHATEVGLGGGTGRYSGYRAAAKPTCINVTARRGSIGIKFLAKLNLRN